MVVCSISSKLGLPECYENRTEPIATNAPPACWSPELLFWSLGCGLWPARELMLGRCSSSTYPKKENLLFFGTHLPSWTRICLPSACGGNATPRPHLSNKFHQFKLINYYMHVTFFCSPEIYKKVLNTLEILDFICKEFVTSDQAHNPWVGRGGATEGISQACCSCQARAG